MWSSVTASLFLSGSSKSGARRLEAIGTSWTGESVSMLPSVLALFSAFAYGAADFLGGLATQRSNIVAVVIVSQAAWLALLAATIVFLPGSSPQVRDLAWGGLAGLAGGGGVALLYRALAIGPMSIVAPRRVDSGGGWRGARRAAHGADSGGDCAGPHGHRAGGQRPFRLREFTLRRGTASPWHGITCCRRGKELTGDREGALR
jgi:uncharacterized membrane protein